MMKKLILIFVFFLTFTANADALYTKTNQCVYDLVPYNSKGWCYTKKSNNQKKCNKKAKYTDFIDGFYIDDNGVCMLYTGLQATGMSYNQFQFNQGLLANLFGFFLVFLVGFLYVLQGRR